ncbi:MAG: T9SS type A sorting domain-containing protein [Bacteroidota bacterium]
MKTKLLPFLVFLVASACIYGQTERNQPGKKTVFISAGTHYQDPGSGEFLPPPVFNPSEILPASDTPVEGAAVDNSPQEFLPSFPEKREPGQRRDQHNLSHKQQSLRQDKEIHRFTSATTLMPHDPNRNTKSALEQGKQLDKIVGKYWDEDLGHWGTDLTYKAEIEYDGNGNRTFLTYYSWDAETETWVEFSKREYTYDENNYNTLYIFYYWDPEIPEWYPYSKSEYDYDESGHRIYTASYSWIREQSAWKCNSIYEYAYTGNFQTLYAYYSWNADLNAVIGVDKYEITLNENNLTVSRLIFTWDIDNGQWTKVAKYDFSYNGSGREIERIYSLWNPSTEDWDPMTRVSTTYYEDVREAEKQYWNWDFVLTDWRIAKKDVYSYDGSTRLTEMLTLFWDDLLSDWVYSKKTEYEWDENGNRSLEIFALWNKELGNWDYLAKYEYSYNAEQKLLYYGYFTWSQDYGEWLGVTKREYKYDQYGNIIYNAYYSWRADYWSWYGTSRTDYTYNAAGVMLTFSYFIWNWDNYDWAGTDFYTYVFEDGRAVGIEVVGWETGDWELWEENYTYNEHQDLIVMEDSDFDNLTGEKIPNGRSELEYDELNRCIRVTNFYMNDQTQTWRSEYKTEFTYDAQNRLYETFESEWNSDENDWLTWEKTVNFYNAQGLLERTEEFYWPYEGSDWEIDRKTEYSYNADNLLSQCLTSDWYSGENKWVSQYKASYTYNTNKRIDSELEYYYNSYEGGWQEEYKAEYSYTENGKLHEKTSFWKSDSDWMQSGRESYDYDPSVSLSQLVIPDNLSIYFLDGMLLTLKYSYWDSDLSDWQDDEEYEMFYSDVTLISGSIAAESGSVRVYPNPVDQLLFVSQTDPAAEQLITVYSIRGEKIRELTTCGTLTGVDLSDCAPGIYIIKVTGDSGNLLERLVKL